MPGEMRPVDDRGRPLSWTQAKARGVCEAHGCHAAVRSVPSIAGDTDCFLVCDEAADRLQSWLLFPLEVYNLAVLHGRGDADWLGGYDASGGSARLTVPVPVGLEWPTLENRGGTAAKLIDRWVATGAELDDLISELLARPDSDDLAEYLIARLESPANADVVWSLLKACKWVGHPSVSAWIEHEWRTVDPRFVDAMAEVLPFKFGKAQVYDMCLAALRRHAISADESQFDLAGVGRVMRDTGATREEAVRRCLEYLELMHDNRRWSVNVIALLSPLVREAIDWICEQCDRRRLTVLDTAVLCALVSDSTTLARLAADSRGRIMEARIVAAAIRRGAFADRVPGSVAAQLRAQDPELFREDGKTLLMPESPCRLTAMAINELRVRGVEIGG